MAADPAIYASPRGAPHTPPTATTLGTPSLAPVERTINFGVGIILVVVILAGRCSDNCASSVL